MNKIKTINLSLAGMGFILYSPFAVSEIMDGDDYLASNFENPIQVQEQALQGKIVGISLGTPGDFIFEIYPDYPTEEQMARHQYKLRAGIEVRDKKLCIRDLFDLMNWSAEISDDQSIEMVDGFYHITLLSSTPVSGLLGDNQTIEIYLHKLNEMPKLRFQGVPTLC